MNILKIKTLHINEYHIDFKPDVNYILGLNNSGKTTIFYSIQYLLGLRNELNHYTQFFGSKQAYLEVSVNDMDYRFTRTINSRNIDVHSRNNQYNFFVNSSKYDEFLVSIFQPRYRNPISVKEIKSLIKESFISEDYNNEIKLASRFSKDMSALLLGVNTSYTNQIRHYVNQLQSEIKQREASNQEVLSYKDNVAFLVERELTNVDTSRVEEILNSAYNNHLNRHRELLSLYEKSKSLLDDINSESEQELSEITSKLNIQFQQNLQHLFITDKTSFEDVINSKLYGSSYGKKAVLNLLARITIQSNYRLTNSVGLVVNDSGATHLYREDTSSILRDLTKSICITSGCQYIEFTFDSRYINSNDIICDLEKGGVMLKNITLPIVISSFVFIVALCTFIFGNNINEQLKQSEIVYNSQKISLQLPSRIRNSNFKIDSIPDSYRQVCVKNIGHKPSQNLRISIVFDGEIIESEIKCNEDIKDTVIGKSSIRMDLDRLANNAEITCKVWLKQNQNPFSVKSIDNLGAKDAQDESSISETNYVRIIAIIAMISIACFLTYRLYLLPKNIAHKLLLENHGELQGQYEQLSNELAEIRPKVEEEEEQDNVDFMTKLQELVNTHSNKKNSP